jgi:hypothetical protein
VHHVKAVSQSDFIHAKPHELTRIFEIVIANVPSKRRGGTAALNTSLTPSLSSIGSGGPDEPRRSKGLLRSHKDNMRSSFSSRSTSLGNVLGLSLEKMPDSLDINGYEFIKQKLSKFKFCNICQKSISSIMFKAVLYECKHCHFVAHSKHFEVDEAITLIACPGDIEVKKLYFMAPSESELSQWVQRLSGILASRSERNLHRNKTSESSSQQETFQESQESGEYLDVLSDVMEEDKDNAAVVATRTGSSGPSESPRTLRQQFIEQASSSKS